MTLCFHSLISTTFLSFLTLRAQTSDNQRTQALVAVHCEPRRAPLVQLRAYGVARPRTATCPVSSPIAVLFEQSEHFITIFYSGQLPTPGLPSSRLLCSPRSRCNILALYVSSHRSSSLAASSASKRSPCALSSKFQTTRASSRLSSTRKEKMRSPSRSRTSTMSTCNRRLPGLLVSHSHSGCK